MVSVRNVCNLLGLRGNVSILRDFFGYINNGQQNRSSLIRAIDLLRGNYFNINIIIVASDLYNNAQLMEIDRALEVTRDIYANHGIGIGCIQRFNILQANSMGLQTINNDTDYQNLLRSFSFAGQAIDVFFIRLFVGLPIGRSPVNGTCIKDNNSNDGLVVSIEATQAETNIAFAHELGHYLGLSHVCTVASGTCAGGTCTCSRSK